MAFRVAFNSAVLAKAFEMESQHHPKLNPGPILGEVGINRPG
jgi:hypothetical protein